MADKVAVFLDVENLSGWLKAGGGQTLWDYSTKLGDLLVCKAYGNFSLPSVNARQNELNALGFEFVHVHHPVKGKNAADIQLTVDVMEYATGDLDLEWFVLATSDADFSPLFRRLRSMGKSVVGVGSKSALSDTVEKVCSQFVYTSSRASHSKEQAKAVKASTQSEKLLQKARQLLIKAISQHPRGADLSRVKNSMLTMDSKFDESTLGFKQFKKFLASEPKIITLYQMKSTWYAKAAQQLSTSSTTKSTTALTTDTALSSLPKASTQQTRQPMEPTVEDYRRLLRQMHWLPCKSAILWDALTKLDAYFRGGFTRAEALACLIESFGQCRTNTSLRSDLSIFFKAGFLKTGLCSSEFPLAAATKPTFSIKLPESEKWMAKQIDKVMLPRLLHACASHNVPFRPELCTPLLLSSYETEDWHYLIALTQSRYAKRSAVQSVQ